VRVIGSLGERVFSLLSNENYSIRVKYLEPSPSGFRRMS
jgi:hypothetical protein